MITKEIEFKVIAPTFEEIKQTEEYKLLMDKIKSMTKTIPV